MKRKLKKFGWVLAEHNLQKEMMDDLVLKKEVYLESAIQAVQKEFNITFSKFEGEKIEYIELTKAITRSLLRYDPSAIGLAKAVLNQLNNTFGLTNEVRYCTLSYPIIHFPFDTSELGTKHKDGYHYIEHFYTTWAPLNDCYNKPLAITEKTHQSQSKIIRKIRNRLKVIDKISDRYRKVIKPDIKKGEFMMWYGSTDHEGLMNTSDAITIAMVIRFTSSPIMFEGSLSTKELAAYQTEKTASDPNELIRKFISIYKEIRNHQAFFSTDKTEYHNLLLQVKSKIASWSLTGNDLKKLSFMLTLWGQRLENKMDVSLFYFYAINCAHDSLYSLHKSLQFLLNTFSIASSQKFVDMVMSECPSIQAGQIIKDILKEDKAQEVKMKIDNEQKLPLLKWSV
jgi:hypothetical protein